MDGRKWLGWWIVTTPQGKEYATEYYEGDTYDEAQPMQSPHLERERQSKVAAVRKYQG